MFVPNSGARADEWVDKEKQVTIFFPKVTISSISDVRAVHQLIISARLFHTQLPYHEYDHIESKGYSFIRLSWSGARIYRNVSGVWGSTEWGCIWRGEKETPGEVWVMARAILRRR
jgi:hypothetical protein